MSNKLISSVVVKDVERSLKIIMEGECKEQFFNSPLFCSLVKSIFEPSSNLPDLIRTPLVTIILWEIIGKSDSETVGGSKGQELSYKKRHCPFAYRYRS